MKILFMGAEPKQQVQLRLGEEMREIREKLQLSKARDEYELHERMAVRPADLSQHLLDVEPVIVHFSGHGTGKHGLCFESVTGTTQLVSAAALSALFAQFDDKIKCVVLNACYSEEQAKAIVQHVPFVVGMNDTVNDRAAIAFAVGFYQALGARRSVKQAFELGKTQILLQGVPDADIPVLLVKPGADATLPFDSRPSNQVEGRITTATPETTPGTASTGPIIWEMPPAPDVFTGRQAELAKIGEVLSRKQRVALVGMPGVGKSATARQWAEENKNDYRYGFHIIGDTQENTRARATIGRRRCFSCRASRCKTRKRELRRFSNG